MNQWRVYPASRFTEVASRWDALNRKIGDLPFMRSAFIAPALSIFGNGRELLAVSGPEDDPVAMGVLRETRLGMWQTFQPSQLPLGAFLMRESAAFNIVLDGLAAALPRLTLGVAVTQQDPQRATRPAETPILSTLDYIQTAAVPVSGSFADYWAARGKNLRHNIKKQLAKLAQDRVPTRLEIITLPSDVADAVADYGRLESAGWKAQEGTAVGAENAQGRFYRQVLETFSLTHSARIYRYWFGNNVVAMDLCVESADTLVILKTAYDESVKAVSPAFLMRHSYFRTIFDEGKLTRIEFFGRVMEWHLRWTEDVRMLYHVNCYRWPWLKTAHRMCRPGNPQTLPRPIGLEADSRPVVVT